MVMLHPGRETDLARGPRLLLAVSHDHAASVALTLDPADGLTLSPARGGRWVVEGRPGSSATVWVVGADRRMMRDTMTVTLSLPGGPSPVATTWELGDVQVDQRDRVALMKVVRTEAELWQVTSLVPGSARGDRPGAQPSRATSGATPVGGLGEPVTLDAAIVVDRSASMQWTLTRGVLTDVVAGLLWARQRALTADSTLAWYTYGARNPDTHAVEAIEAGDRTAEEIARSLAAQPPTSGAALGSVLRTVSGRQVLIAITDAWPEPQAVRACRDAGLRLGVVLAGIPSDPATWPVDWSDQDAACRALGADPLPLGDGTDAQTRVRQWCARLLGEPAPAAAEVPR